MTKIITKEDLKQIPSIAVSMDANILDIPTNLEFKYLNRKFTAGWCWMCGNLKAVEEKYSLGEAHVEISINLQRNLNGDHLHTIRIFNIGEYELIFGEDEFMICFTDKLEIVDVSKNIGFSAVDYLAYELAKMGMFIIQNFRKQRENGRS